MIQLPLQFVGSPKPAFIEEFWTPVGRNLWGEPLGRESMTGACHEDEGPICKLPDARFSLLRSSKLTIRDGKYSALPSRRPPAQGRWLLSPETAELLPPVNRPFPTRQHDGRSHSTKVHRSILHYRLHRRSRCRYTDTSLSDGRAIL